MKIKQALQDFNIEIVTLENLVNVRAEQPELWSWIDPSPSVHAATDLQDLEGNGGSFVLPFEVRYQLEVCISRNILNELNITKEFVKTLSEIASEDSSKAQSILEYIAEQDNRIYNPMSIFEDKEALAFSPRSEIPHYCAYSRKATITPTTIYFNSPTVKPQTASLDIILERTRMVDSFVYSSQTRWPTFVNSYLPLSIVTNYHRAASTPVPTNREMMSSLLEFIGHCSMASVSEIGTMSS
jgi:hypothetical protein